MTSLSAFLDTLARLAAVALSHDEIILLCVAGRVPDVEASPGMSPTPTRAR